MDISQVALVSYIEIKHSRKPPLPLVTPLNEDYKNALLIIILFSHYKVVNLVMSSVQRAKVID